MSREDRGELSPLLTLPGGADRRSDPASGGRCGVRLAGAFFGAPAPQGRAPEWWGARGWACGRRVGVGRAARAADRRWKQVGPPRGSAKCGRGRGPGQVCAGARWSFREMFAGSWQKLCPWDQAPRLCPSSESGRFYNKTRGSQAGPDGRGRDREDPSGLGPDNEQICLRVALGHDVWTLPCQCLVFVACGYFRTKW